MAGGLKIFTETHDTSFSHLSALSRAVSRSLSPSPSILSLAFLCGLREKSLIRSIEDRVLPRPEGLQINTSFAGRDLLSSSVSNSSDVTKKRNRVQCKTPHKTSNFPDTPKVLVGPGPIMSPVQDPHMLNGPIRKC